MQEPEIADLGTLAGDILAFGGPGSNLEATQALLARAAAAGIGPDRRICTGDAVAYCADPAATVAALDGQAAWIAGNCERQLAAGADDCGCGFGEGSACDRLAAQWYAHANARLGADARARFAALPDIAVFENRGRRWAVVHGGATVNNRFIWPSDADEVFMSEIAALEERVGQIDGVIAGHCGLAFERVIDGRRWVNAGSIVLPPNDGRTETRFVVLGEDGVRIERLAYDFSAAARAMQEAGLTQGYDRTLTTGYWPSEDILPPALRAYDGSRASG